MSGRTCHHCKQWIEKGEAHDCWSTTEAALTVDLSEDLREAWLRLREAAAELGEQRIYASHHCIMFSRQAAYFFVRPKRSYLEVCIFLGRTVQAPQIRRVTRVSALKLAHFVQVRHRDEVEAPLTDWLEEAYALPDAKPKPPVRKAPGLAVRARTPVAPARIAAKTGRAGARRKR
jgi:hypothetical protein